MAERRRGSALWGLVALAAGPALFLSGAALVGLGLLRSAPIGPVFLASIALVTLPVLGIASALGGGRTRTVGIALGSWLWPAALLTGLPLFFPGERDQALALGCTSMTAGAPLCDSLALLPAEPALARSPAEEAQPLASVLPTPPPRPPRLLELDEVVVPFEGETGHSLRVPALFDSPDGYSEEFWMLFDTGATLTTLSREALAALGVPVPADAPTITLNTAAGAVETKQVLVERVWLGDVAVEGVTVAICEDCAHNGIAGLLGLNVSGQFEITLDQARHEMTLRPREGEPDRHIDVGQWLELSTRAARWPDGRIEIEVRGDNRARYPIAWALVNIDCGDTRWAAELTSIGARDEAETLLSLPASAACDSYRISLAAGRWAPL